MRSAYILLGLFLGLIIATAMQAEAGKITSPVPISKDGREVEDYLLQIYNNFHKAEVITTNPDGSRHGDKGEYVILQTGGSEYFEVNTDGSTTWRGIKLIDVP